MDSAVGSLRMLTLFPDELVIDNPAMRWDCWCTAASAMVSRVDLDLGDRGNECLGC